MSRTLTCEALILRTYDTGEADRFCILLTREQGRITATATGVRKITARLGGYLLPFRHLSLQLRESKSGSSSPHFYIAGAVPADPPLDGLTAVASFAQAQEGVEFLLTLVSHEEPDPSIFDAAVTFLTACRAPSPGGVPAFQLRLLHLLGLLPDDRALESVLSLSREEQTFVCAARASEGPAPLSPSCLPRVRELCLRCCADHLTGTLKAPSVIGAMMAQG